MAQGLEGFVDPAAGPSLPAPLALAPAKKIAAPQRPQPLTGFKDPYAIAPPAAPVEEPGWKEKMNEWGKSATEGLQEFSTTVRSIDMKEGLLGRFAAGLGEKAGEWATGVSREKLAAMGYKEYAARPITPPTPDAIKKFYEAARDHPATTLGEFIKGAGEDFWMFFLPEFGVSGKLGEVAAKVSAKYAAQAGRVGATAGKAAELGVAGGAATTLAQSVEPGKFDPNEIQTQAAIWGTFGGFSKLVERAPTRFKVKYLDPKTPLTDAHAVEMAKEINAAHPKERPLSPKEVKKLAQEWKEHQKKVQKKLSDEPFNQYKKTVADIKKRGKSGESPSVDEVFARAKRKADAPPPAGGLSVETYVDNYIAGLGRDSPDHTQFALNHTEEINAEFARRGADERNQRAEFTEEPSAEFRSIDEIWERHERETEARKIAEMQQSPREAIALSPGRPAGPYTDLSSGKEHPGGGEPPTAMEQAFAQAKQKTKPQPAAQRLEEARTHNPDVTGTQASPAREPVSHSAIIRRRTPEGAKAAEARASERQARLEQQAASGDLVQSLHALVELSVIPEVDLRSGLPLEVKGGGAQPSESPKGYMAFAQGLKDNAGKIGGVAAALTAAELFQAEEDKRKMWGLNLAPGHGQQVQLLDTLGMSALGAALIVAGHGRDEISMAGLLKDTATLAETKKSLSVTSPIMESLNPFATDHTPQEIREIINRKGIKEEDKKVFLAILQAHETGNQARIARGEPPKPAISSHDLTVGFKLQTQDIVLTPQDTQALNDRKLVNVGIVDSKGGSDYKNGLVKPAEGQSDLPSTTTSWQLPQELSDKNHLKDGRSFGTTRSIQLENGIEGVHEVQSDLAQHQRVLTDEKAEELKARGKELEEEIKKSSKEVQEARTPEERAAAQEHWNRIGRLRDELREGQGRLATDEVNKPIRTATDAAGLTPLTKAAQPRLVQQVLERAGNRGDPVVWFANPDTVAKIQGFEPVDFKARLEMLKAEEAARKERGDSAIKDDDLKRAIARVEDAIKKGHKYEPSEQGIYDKYAKELQLYLNSLGGKARKDARGLDWTEVPTRPGKPPLAWGSADPELVKWLGLGGLIAGMGVYSYNHPKDFNAALATGLLSAWAARKILPGGERVGKMLDDSWNRVFPEHASRGSEKAAAHMGHRLAEAARSASTFKWAQEKLEDFFSMRKEEGLPFILNYEKGKKQANPMLDAVAKSVREWGDRIFEQDAANGIQYDPRDNYIVHQFEGDPSAIAKLLDSKYGTRWGDPSFSKERQFKYLEDALEYIDPATGEHPFKLKTDNPITLMRMRQAASDMAAAKVSILKDFEGDGLARKLGKGDKLEPGEFDWRSPNGDVFAVGQDVNQVLHNAFKDFSLWLDPTALGASFRVGMALKSATIPIKLLSAFHFAHLTLAMPSATTISTAVQSLLAHNYSPKNFFDLASGATVVGPAAQMSYMGHRSMAMYEGRLKNPTVLDKARLQRQIEGGMIPSRAQEEGHGVGNWGHAAQRKFVLAVQDQKWMRAGAFAVPAAVGLVTHGFLGAFVPRLKLGAYDLMADAAIRNDPRLAVDDTARVERLRQITKVVESRFGQMQYSQRFWNKLTKDALVLSFLSAGWQAGLLDMTVGAGKDIGKAVKAGGIGESARLGLLERPLFLPAYAGQTAIVAGLITYMMTGEEPEGMDYLAPRSGTEIEGKPVRLNTPFYTLEGAKIYKHLESEGLAKTARDTVANKMYDSYEVLRILLLNKDSQGLEMSNPESSALQQLVQRGSSVLQTLTPMALEAVERKGLDSLGWQMTAMAGFSPAPNYLDNTATENKIDQAYRKEVGSHEISYVKGKEIRARGDYKAALRAGNDDKAEAKADVLRDDFGLQEKDLAKMRKSLRDPQAITRFKSLSPETQAQLLDKMPGEELIDYLRVASPKARKLYLESEDESSDR
jgi:hypothetical protein